jgi:hypothetical protein
LLEEISQGRYNPNFSMEAYDNYEGQEMEGDLYETEENLNFNAR